MKTKFQRYSKIINDYKVPAFKDLSGVFDVTEKIDGANFSIWVTKDDIRPASRSRFLTPDEKFFNYKIAYTEELKLKCRDLYERMEKDTLVITGELHGGDGTRWKPIQTRILYGPDIKLIFFELSYVDQFGEMVYFNNPYAELMFKIHDIPHVPIKFSGTYEECMNFHLDYEHEGIVIKRRQERESREWYTVKRVNEKFREMSGVKYKKSKRPQSVSPETEFLFSFVTENRVHSAISKLGDMTIRDHKLVSETVKQDIIDELPENHGGDLHKMGKNVGYIVAKVLKARDKEVKQWTQS